MAGGWEHRLLELRILTTSSHRRHPALAGARIAALAVLLAGCTASSGPAPSVSADFEFTERVTIELHVARGAAGHLETDGGVASMMLMNNRSHAVRVTHVDVQSDDDLDVSVLGHCIRACFGAGYWEPRTAAEVAKGIEGTYPLELGPGPDGRHRLVFRLQVRTEEGVKRLRTGCLVLHTVTLTLDGGEKALVRAFGDRSVVGVHADDDANKPPPSTGCDREFGLSRPPRSGGPSPAPVASNPSPAAQSAPQRSP